MIDIYREELRDLTKAYLATSLAFAILIFKDTLGSTLKISFDFYSTLGFSIVVAAITVGLGFILHELAHRAAAKYFKKHAMFKSNDQMLILSIIVALLTPMVIAAPGAVYIYGHHISRRENGLISAAGPATNIVLSALFLLISLVPNTWIHLAALYGFMINAWLAIFNLIPIPGFDGEKIIEWSKLSYFGMVLAALLLNMIQIITPNLVSI